MFGCTVLVLAMGETNKTILFACRNVPQPIIFELESTVSLAKNIGVLRAADWSCVGRATRHGTINKLR